MRKIISMVLALALTLSLGTAALAAENNTGSLENFKPKNTYSNQFTDVKESDFCYEGVKLCYEYGIMNGISASKFGPSQTMTHGQLMIVAARLRNIYMGGTGEFPISLPNFDLWENAAEYLRQELGAPFAAFGTSYGERRMLAVFGMIFGDEVFTPINHLTSVPDFSSFPAYYQGAEEQILKLYNAGILTGSDEYGTFYNDSPITRGAVATIVARILDPSLRKTLNLKEGKPAIVGVMSLGFDDCPNFMKFYEENKQYFTYFNESSLTLSNAPAPLASLEMTVEHFDGGYRVRSLGFGEDGKRQYELMYALLKDVCEDPDAVYAKLQERNEILSKGYNGKFTEEAAEWNLGEAWKEYKIGNVLLRWGETTFDFTIKTAS